MASIPRCPNCGTAIPFGQVQFKRGKEFLCEKCGTELVLPKANALRAVALYVGMLLIFKILGSGLLAFAVVCLVIIAGNTLEYLTARVQLHEHR